MNHDPHRSEDSVDDLDQEVISLLRSLPTEQGSPSESTDAAILQMASEKMSAIKRQNIIKRSFFGIAAMAACIAISFYIGNLIAPPVELPPYAGTPVNVTPREDTAAIILKEVAAVFPGQLQSIQRDASGLKITLSETPTVETTEGILIVVKHENEVKEIITFNGQTVDILGHMVTVDATKDGLIKIHGSDFEWNSDRPAKPLPNLVIEATHI